MHSLPARIAIAITTRAAQSMGDYEAELHSEAVELAEAMTEAYAIENHRHVFSSQAIDSEQVREENLDRKSVV